VDLVGIEPTTSSMPWKRAPSCATGPFQNGVLINSYARALVSQTSLAEKSPNDRSRIEWQHFAKAVKMGMLTRRLPNMNRYLPALLVLLLCAGMCVAQAPAPPVSYSSISELNQLLAGLQQASQAIQDDLSHLRIEKWKTDSNTKKQSQSDTESIQRNLQSALPGMLNDLKNSPESAPLTFKVYRNLDALYDVMNSVVESTGAFGNKEEFQSLNKDLSALEESRRNFAGRMDKVAAAKETEISQLRAALQTARAEIPPKKTVVDDTKPATDKKPVKKKKTTPPKPPNTTPATQTPPQ
jgi:hypothetical protein